jgi:MFS family permease
MDAEPDAGSPATRGADGGRRLALRFVLVIGISSLFADFTYEGARSVLGPYLALLGASGTIVGIVTGLGELLGYSLRLASGRLADATRQFWPITISGYVLQMSAVPLLALTTSWQWAAVLIVLERIGKAVRNPPRDVMLSFAARQAGGYGWAFGVHEAMDQAGAMLGPLAVSFVLAWSGSYREAFAVLAVPAAINVACILTARWLYPAPHELETGAPAPQGAGGRRLPRVFWIYLLGAGLVAAGFADYPLVAFHFGRTGSVPIHWIAIFYSVAMAVSGSGSLLFGRLFDRFGFPVLVALTLVAAAFAPLVFLGGFWLALAGAALWGLGMGVHESIIPAAVAPMVPAERRATAFGLFTAGYGLFWFLGSAAIGILYDRSLPATIGFCLALQLAAVPIFVWVGRVASVADDRPPQRPDPSDPSVQQ